MTDNMSLNFIINARDNTKAAMQSVTKGVDKIQGKLKKMQPTFQKMALSGGIAFGAVSAGVWTATQKAVNAQEIFSKFNTVFDEVGTKAEEVAKDLRDNWGLAESTAKDLLSSTGDLLSGFGFTGDAALDLSERTQKLSIDLASFTNLQGGSARASEIITKALLGERDSLIALGVKILDADVKQRLLEEGKEKLEGMALRQAKAEITLQLIMEQSGKALGDYERTSESAANQQRLLQERVKELSEKLGTLFVPILEKVIDKVVPVIEKIVKWTEENPKLTMAIIAVTLGLTGLITIIGILGIALPGIIAGLGLLATAIGVILSPVGLVIAAIIAFVAIGKYLIDNWNSFVESLIVIFDWLYMKLVGGSIIPDMINGILAWFGRIAEALNPLKNFGDVVWGIFNGIKNNVVGMVSGMVSAVANKMSGMLSGVRSAVHSVQSSVSSAVSSVQSGWERTTSGGFGGFMEDVGKVGSWIKDSYQHGTDYVPATGVYQLHKGEAVIPAGANSGGRGITINVLGGNYLDRDAAKMFGEKLAHELKRNIKL